MVHWHLMLEEFAPLFKHVAGVDNDAADALSRLEMIEKLSDVIDLEEKLPPLQYTKANHKHNTNKTLCHNFVAMEFDDEGDEVINHSDTRAFIDENYADCEFPLDVRMFKVHQRRDEKLQKLIKRDSKTDPFYTTKVVEGIELVHGGNRIFVPASLRERVMEWYHTMLCHPGQVRMEQSIKAIYYWQGMRSDIIQLIKTCDVCQRCKRTNKNKYGLLPEKEGEIIKWSRVNVDLWGPKTVRNKNGYDYQIHVMTMVDPVTGWFELEQLFDSPTAFRCQQILDTSWLARYPRPREIGFDNGGEFKGLFAQLCRNMGLKEKKSLPWNPQANAILERIHQVLQDCLTTFELDNVEIPEEGDESLDPFREYLSNAAYAIRCAFHATHGHSPGELVFGRDMFMPISKNIDWNAIKDKKQKAIAKSNLRENSKRKQIHYNPGDWILIKNPGIIRKLAVPYDGPYKVVLHNANGTITYEKEPFFNDKVNARRTKPYYWKNHPVEEQQQQPEVIQ